MSELSHLLIRNPKDDETPIEAATQIFSSLFASPYIPLWKQIYLNPKLYSFEIFLNNQVISFYVTSPQESETFISSLIASSYPKSTLIKTQDPMDELFRSPCVALGEMVLNSYSYLPIKTYADFTDIDPLSSLVGFLAKQDSTVKVVVQIVVCPASFAWQKRAMEAAGHLLADEGAVDPNDPDGKIHFAQNPRKARILQKAGFNGGKAVVRLAVGGESAEVHSILQNLAGTFGSVSQGEGNQFVFKKPRLLKKEFKDNIKKRRISRFERTHQVLNAQELATIWHLPGLLVSGVKNISWGKTLVGEPPENLPIDATFDGINFFAKTEFKNREVTFGIKNDDRRKHVYLIGKTGAGKSTLIANMAICDIRKGRGVGVIDPHGDLSEIILEYIPKRRLNDVVYLEPFDARHPFSLNVLEIKNSQQKDLVASGIVSIFYKLYRESWGPRLEYILRNVILTLLDVPGATLIDILRILADERYRRSVVSKIKDPVIFDFWTKEFERMPESLKKEAISPIQNKVGQFVSSRMIRNIVGVPRSSIDLERIMNEGKILILNLSQGKLGEDNAALLGAMVITQLQLAAMNRAYEKEEDRRDFFLYVDEFQNFATTSFIKILSEARKYRLSLTLANQYMDQLELPVQKAIFGNIGTLISFVVGAHDAQLLSREFSEIYSENELVSLGKYEMVTKLSVDGMMSAPFPAVSLPLPNLKNENKEKIVRLSKERYGRKI